MIFGGRSPTAAAPASPRLNPFLPPPGSALLWRMGKPVVSFGPFRIDLATGELAREGRPMAIGQKGALLLAALAAAGGKAVSKAALMECGWPGLAVEEGNLTVQIAALRKALGQRSDGSEWIVTIPRLGYRLALESAVAADDPHPPAVAVLPFVNLGAGAEQDYFADGVAAEIITALARFRSFSVVSRSSSFAYKGRTVDIRQAASELGVRYLLEGSVRRDGERIRLDVQLIDGVTAGHLWAERFEDVIGHIFDFQDLITERVASTVEPSIEIAEMQRSRRERRRASPSTIFISGRLPPFMTSRWREMRPPIRCCSRR